MARARAWALRRASRLHGHSGPQGCDVGECSPRAAERQSGRADARLSGGLRRARWRSDQERLDPARPQQGHRCLQRWGTHRTGAPRIRSKTRQRFCHDDIERPLYARTGCRTWLSQSVLAAEAAGPFKFGATRCVPGSSSLRPCCCRKREVARWPARDRDTLRGAFEINEVLDHAILQTQRSAGSPVPISPASALEMWKAAMIASMARLKIWTSMASSAQPPKHAQNVHFTWGVSAPYHPVVTSAGRIFVASVIKFID